VPNTVKESIKWIMTKIVQESPKLVEAGIRNRLPTVISRSNVGALRRAKHVR
jgi:hypothetical protein